MKMRVLSCNKRVSNLRPRKQLAFFSLIRVCLYNHKCTYCSMINTLWLHTQMHPYGVLFWEHILDRVWNKIRLPMRAIVMQKLHYCVTSLSATLNYCCFVIFVYVYIVQLHENITYYKKLRYKRVAWTKPSVQNSMRCIWHCINRGFA